MIKFLIVFLMVGTISCSKEIPNSAKDPVCGKIVPTSLEHQIEVGTVIFDDIEFFFCGSDCVMAFMKDVLKFVTPCICAEVRDLQARPKCPCEHCIGASSREFYAKAPCSCE